MRQKFNKIMRSIGYQNIVGEWLLDEIMQIAELLEEATKMLEEGVSSVQ